MLALALSIKTGAYLIFPGFIGCIAWQYGIIPLVGFLIIIVVFQLVIALPLYFTPAATLLGFKFGA